MNNILTCIINEPTHKSWCKIREKVCYDVRREIEISIWHNVNIILDIRDNIQENIEHNIKLNMHNIIKTDVLKVVKSCMK